MAARRRDPASGSRSAGNKSTQGRRGGKSRASPGFSSLRAPTHAKKGSNSPGAAMLGQLTSAKEKKKQEVQVKVAMIGDSQTGKTTLMVKYVEDRFDEDYIETLGVNFMEKTVKLRNVNITFSLWDLGGQDEYLTLMPLACSDAKVILFVFDLCRKSSLISIKQWYRNARKENKYAIPFLIGTKFDLFDKEAMTYKNEVTTQARKFAKAMKAPMIFCSSSHSINIKKIFQIIIAKVFNVNCKVDEIHKVGQPILEYRKTHPPGKGGGGSSKQPTKVSKTGAKAKRVAKSTQ